ncbi:MAG: hypothetical protein KGN36_13935, partial [Acidobacteriota bacterium]|nr:hypothetical protein [Acidobacteriota bacterium]
MGHPETRRNAFDQELSSASAGGSRRTSLKEILVAYGALFASLATLFCCALPALLVLLGFGLTTVQVFFTSIPGWQGFGQYDIWLLPLSGALLAVGF